MSTENPTTPDENISASASSSPEATPQESVPHTQESTPASEPPAPQEVEKQSSASGESTSNAESASSTDSSSAAESTQAEPKRKLQLRPIDISGGSARAVPSVGDSSAPPAAGTNESNTEAQQPASETQEASIAIPPTPRQAVEIPEVENIDAAIEAAIEAAMSGDEVPAEPVPTGAAAALDVETLQPGQKLKGLVQGVHGDSVFVDVGLRLTAAVPFRQFDAKKPPQIGEEVEIAFDKIDDAEGLILANLPRGTTVVKGGDWNAIAVDQVVECVVNKTNKGGLEANVGALRGFIPASQVELGFVADLQQYVGQKIRVRVIEVNPAKKKLVLSRRVLLAEEREAAKAQLLEEIKPDQVRTGRVKTIKEYGAFIDLGGMDGFLPIAQMSWVRIDHPKDIIQEGQEVEVKVLSVDREKNRISLGMRQLAPNPWRTAEDKYPKGSNVTGRVTRVEAFGAFVELEPGVEGLVHISELEHRRVKRVEEVLNVGDMAEVQVLEVDPKKKRISLSAKALKSRPEPVEAPKDEDLAPGQGQRYQRKRRGELKGGTGSSTGGGLFGNPTDY